MSRHGWSLGGVVAFTVSLVLYGAAPAWGATTIDSFSISGAGGTFAECGDTIVEHDDPLPPNGTVTGNGTFAVSHSFAPAKAHASCSSGDGTDVTSGALSSSGAADSSGNLTLRDSNHGATTTRSHFTGGTDCIDIGAQISSSNTVQFTITQAMPYTFTGTATSSGIQTNGKGVTNYKLTGPGPSDTVFDQTQGAPNFNGTLQPGSYTYQASEFASNDLACSETGTETDSYHYTVTLRVGTPLPPPPVNTKLPAITGTPQAGHTLTCSRGTWTNGPTSFKFRWKRNGTAITGATHPTYRVQAADGGHTLTCTVIASNAGGPSSPATSHGVRVPGPPKCTVRSTRRVTIKHRQVHGKSKIVGGTLPVLVACNQAATITLSGALTDQPSGGAAKHFQLSGVQAHVPAGTSASVQLVLPAAAATDLVHHAMETVSAKLAAHNGNGTSLLTAAFSPLRT
jgi:hypothetical protein